MTLPLYFSPINRLSNWIYRNFLLKHGADFVFSELIMADRWDKEELNEKFNFFPEDIPKTIFQIGVSSPEEVSFAVNDLVKRIPGIVEINVNMGCPQSTMQKQSVCSGLLLDPDMMRLISEQLFNSCKENNIVPSVKIRLGPKEDDVKVKDYLKLLESAGVKKVYIHARTLRYNYTKPAMIDELSGLVEEFPNIELIFNGDVDSFESYGKLSRLGCAGVMIGRAALSNPLVFSQIKKEIPSSVDHFDPFLNDLNIIQTKDGRFEMTQKKKELISSFVKFAEKEGMRKEILQSHLSYLEKGVSKKD